MKNVFTNKNFVLIFLGALVSNIGSLFYSFAVSYWILDITNNDAIIQGVYLGVCGITYVISTLFGGVISDRFNKAKIMYLCDYAKAILIGGSAVVILLGQNNTTVNLIILFVMGILSNVIAAIFSPAASSIIPLVVEKEQLQQANSYRSVLGSLQGIIGLFLAGIMYSLLPITVIFIIVAISYFISAVSEMFIRYKHHENENKLTLKSTFLDIKEGFKYVGTKKSLSALLQILILLNFFFAPISSNFISYFIKTDVATNPNYLFNSFLEPEMWGALFSVSLSIASIIFGMIISTKVIDKTAGKRIKKWLFATGILMLAISVSYFIFVDKFELLNVFLVIFIVSAFILGMMLTYINIPLGTAIQMITDEDKLGKVSAIIDMVSQGLTPVATLIAGFVISYLGSSVLLISCSICILVIAIGTMFVKTIDNFE